MINKKTEAKLEKWISKTIEKDQKNLQKTLDFYGHDDPKANYKMDEWKEEIDDLQNLMNKITTSAMKNKELAFYRKVLKDASKCLHDNFLDQDKTCRLIDEILKDPDYFGEQYFLTGGNLNNE